MVILIKIPQRFKELKICSKDFILKMEHFNIIYSFDGEDRLFRGHGQSMYDIIHVRESKIDRIPDVVVWAGKHLIT